MKEKIVSIVGIVLISLAAIYIYNYEQSNYSGEIQLVTENISDVSKIHLDLETYNVKLTTTDTLDNQIKVIHNGEKASELITKKDGDELKIYEKNKSHFLNFIKPSHELEVLVPHNMIDKLIADVVNGNVEIKSNIDNIDVEVVNGSVTIDSEVKNIEIEGVNTEIKLKVKKDIIANLDSVNGSLDLQFAPDLNYELEISTLNGTIDDEILGVKEKNLFDTKTLNKGTGGSKIKFSTVNGDAIVKHID